MAVKPKPPTAGRRPGSSAASSSNSPRVSHTSSPVETLPVLIRAAEDFFSKARASVSELGRTRDTAAIEEYHKLIATGLGCLEAAMQSNKLWPRLEARLRLRYAGMLVEETVNTMEAETALTKGIALCDKHRLADLKYCMQFLFAKALFQRNPKAALISLDHTISESATYKQAAWVYVFRFLKAAFYVEAGSSTDPHAFENLRSLASVADQRGDKAICVVASLLEALAHLGAMKEDAILRVQTCIAQASKFQLDASTRLPQIDVLLLFLDIACSLLQKQTNVYSQKLAALQSRMDDLKSSGEWDPRTSELLLPIRKQPGSSQTISDDTACILRRGDGETDYLVLPALTYHQAFALAYTFHGLFTLAKSTTIGKSSQIWKQALKVLKDHDSKPPSSSLPEAIRQADWDAAIACYVQILIGLQSATLSEWAKVKECLQAIRDLEITPSKVLGLLHLYLTGVFEQGTANLGQALKIFEDPRFDLEANQPGKAGVASTEFLLSVLAALNRIWIMQDPAHRNDAKTSELIETLRPLCADAADVEVRMVFNLVLASLRTQAPASINQIKRHIQQSLNGAQATSNTHCLSIALNIMRCRLFENVVGEQALKSARASAAQAKKAGNQLWMSVAEGMLAQSLEMQGALAEAKATRENGVRLANKALAMSQC
ncbi:hypothetical protein VTK73DRAFT_2420 [Phialemonium thermophilum]|uniref:Cohesin loading factor n=1 Tax=Phialemonium thermophilum TaxID=223376 RepID=A0ABR3VS57_9PEZI